MNIFLAIGSESGIKKKMWAVLVVVGLLINKGWLMIIKFCYCFWTTKHYPFPKCYRFKYVCEAIGKKFFLKFFFFYFLFYYFSFWVKIQPYEIIITRHWATFVINYFIIKTPILYSVSIIIRNVKNTILQETNVYGSQ